MEQPKFLRFPSALGIFRFKRAQFGYINSPVNQQFVMAKRVDRLFRIAWKDLLRFIASFVDDTHLEAMTFADLLAMIMEVLQHLVTLNYSVVPRSIQFGTAVEALGQRISRKVYQRTA